jgi:transcriptional regulator with XRE-family HTH domain
VNNDFRSKTVETQDIKTLRKKLGLSQRQFAKRLGVKRLAIARWESGTRTPTKENVKRLLQIARENSISTLDTKSEDVSNELSTLDTKIVESEQENVSSLDTKSKNVESKVDTLSTKSENVSSLDTKVVSSEQEIVSSGDTKMEKVESNVDTKKEIGYKVDTNPKVDTTSEDVESFKRGSATALSTDTTTEKVSSQDTSSEMPSSAERRKTELLASHPPVVIVGDKPTYNENPKRKTTKRRSPFVQSVLDQIPIEDEIGKDVQLRHSSKKFVGLCPFHNDNHPSFEVYPHTQSWFCYGCQKGGSLIDYVMYRDGLTPAESIRRLCETYNIPQPSWTEKEKAEWEETKKEKELIAEINLKAFKWYHDQMPPERLQYYQERGIVDDTIDKDLLGYAPDNDAILGEMLKNYKAEQLISSGLFTVVGGCLEPIYKRRYVIPYWEDGKIVYSIGRLDTDDPDEIAQLPEWNRGKYKKQLVHNDSHPQVSKVVKNVIWNADCVSLYETGSIAEGIIDGILHKQISDEIMVICGEKPACGVGVISPVTTKFSSNDIEQLINVTSHWEKVYCIADNEESHAGILGAVQTAKTLFKAGRNPYIVLPPRPDDVEKVDLADYLNVPPDLTETRTKEFEQLLSSSPSLLDYLISEAKKTEDTTKQDELVTSIVSLMVALNPIKLERYKGILEAELGVKRGVFKSLFEIAKKEREEEERKLMEFNLRTVNVEAEQPADEETLRRYGDVLETEEGYAQVIFKPITGLQLEKISSFLIKPKSRLWIDDYEAVSTDLVTASKRGSATALSTGKTYSTIFERHHWNELKLFMGRLPSIDLVWQGKLPEVQAVMGIVNSYEVPVQKGTRQIGWYNVGSEAEPKLIWVAKDINIAKEGFKKTPFVLYCPYTGEMELENAISFRDCDDATFKQQCDLAKELVNLNETNVILPILGWFFAVPFKRHFLNHPDYRHFPHLNIWGTRGSGKSGMAKLLWRMFGYTASDLPSASQTRFALLRMFTSTNSYPICIDEYKPYDMKAGSPEAVRHFMRLSYDGMMDSRGRPDQTLVSYRVVAPVCLIGESPIDESALMERIIPAIPQPLAIDKEQNEGKQRRELFYQLNETNWEGFFVRYLRYCLSLDFKSALDDARGSVLYYLQDRPVASDRIFDNLVCCQFGMERFIEFLSLSLDNFDELMKSAIINIVDTLCGDGGARSKLAVETMLEQLSIMAETERLTHGVHYVVNQSDGGQDQIYLRLSACLAEFRRFVRETNFNGEVLSDAAYQRQLRELNQEGRLVCDTSKPTKGWKSGKAQRAVVLFAEEEEIDLSGFNFKPDFEVVNG